MFASADLLSRLQAVPERIARATTGWNDRRLRGGAAQDTWSAAQILAHLRASDDIVLYRIYAVLARDNPQLPAFDERQWAEIAGYAQADFEASLRVFALRRAELVDVLRRAAPSDWQRLGTHETSGRFTLAEAVERLLSHEEEHCAQLEELAITTQI
jgi:hypothetical protein